MTDNRTTELLQVGDILLNEPVNERIVVVDADAVSVWLRKVEKNDELLIYDGNVWAKLGIKHGNKNRCSQHYAQTVFEFDGYVQQGIAATVGNGTCELVTSGTPCEGNTDVACNCCGAYNIGEYYDGYGHRAAPKFCPECGRQVKR